MLKEHKAVDTYFDISGIDNTAGLKVYYFDNNRGGWRLYNDGGKIAGDRLTFSIDGPIELRVARVVADSDNDGLADHIEDVLGTDKLSPDTDSDGYNDKMELDNGYSPTGRGKIKMAEFIRYKKLVSNK